MIQLDELFQDLGEFGLSQLIMVMMLSYYGIASGINFLATVFIAYQPDHRCKVSPLDNKTIHPELNETQILMMTSPYNEETEEYDRCSRYGFNLNDCIGNNLNCINMTYPPIPCDLGVHYEEDLFTETIITEFGLVCEKKYLKTLSTSLFYAGVMLGSIGFGNISDWFGRRMCGLIAFSGVLVCMIGVALSNSVILFMVFRFWLAVFSYGVTLGSFVYIMEIVGKKWRTAFGIGYQIFFAFGYMILGGIAYIWRDWHHMMIASTIVSSPFLIMLITLPESPRWLFSNNKEEQGVKVVTRMSKVNKVAISDQTWNRARSNNVERSQKFKHSSIDLFRSKETLIITLKIIFNWFVNSLVYYGVSLNAGSLAGNLFINNTLNGVFEILAYLFCIIIMDRVGRKLLLTFLLLLTGVGLLCSVIINIYSDSSRVLITLGLVFAFVSKFGISGSFAVIYNYTSEIYPTVIRSNGVAIGSLAARIGGIVAPYLIELQDHVNWLPNTVFGIFSIVAGLLSLTFPDTTGHSMMESIEEAEIFYRGEKRGQSNDKCHQVEYRNASFVNE